MVHLLQKKHKKHKGKKFLIILLTVLLILLCLYLYYFKYSKPSKVHEGLGVNIHFTGKQVDIDMISDAGFNMVRTDIFWSFVEETKGVYDFQSTGYDSLTKELINEGIRPYYILDYSNTLYEKHGGAIVTNNGRKAFNRYVEAVTSRYKNNGIIWEIWNEPNIDWPEPNVNDYTLLLKQTAKTIKENDPSGIVVAPALAGLSDESVEWLEEIFKKGILDYIDAISVHPYRSWEPESVTSEYENLRELISKYTSKEIPIISGEWGYSIAKGWNGLYLSEEDQAAYLVRMFLINQLNQIPISVWYDWKNDGDDPNDGEHHFGIRQEDVNVSKLAYHAMNTYSYLLADYHLEERIETQGPDDYVLKFVNEEEETVYVLWTIEGSHEITFPINNIKGAVLSMFGQSLYDFDSELENTIEISEKPIYLLENN